MQFHPDYKFVRNLGKGAFGTVDLYEHKLSGKLVAVKKFNPLSTKPEDIQRELYALENLSNTNTQCNPGIVCIFETITVKPANSRGKDQIFMITEYITGETLMNVLIDNPKISSDKLLQWMKEIASSVDYMHSRNFVHRDLKPANIMINNTGSAKVIDLGLTCIDTGTAQATECKNVSSGTLLFAAPELLTRNLVKGLYKKLDIYALGKTFRIIATGLAIDFPTNDDNVFIRNVVNGNFQAANTGDDTLDDLIMSMINLDARNRPNIKDVVRVLNQIKNPQFKRHSTLLQLEDSFGFDITKTDHYV